MGFCVVVQEMNLVDPFKKMLIETRKSWQIFGRKRFGKLLAYEDFIFKVCDFVILNWFKLVSVSF